MILPYYYNIIIIMTLFSNDPLPFTDPVKTLFKNSGPFDDSLVHVF